ncbi:MAG: 4Fe-4S binding protein [Lentisphaeria bacterium]
MPAVVDKETCTGCENCVEVCPVDAISMNDGKAEVDDSCIDCGQCVDECPVDAISMQ